VLTLNQIIYEPKTENESIILELIINHRKISRADLSKMTGLTKAAITPIIRKLMEEDLVYETELGKSTVAGGRKPILLAFNGKSATSLVIDIGTDYLTASLAYLDGERIHFIDKNPLQLTDDTIKPELEKIVKEMRKLNPGTTYGIIGITAAIHAPVFKENIVYASHYNLNTEHLREMLNEVTGHNVILENEANLGSLGEFSLTPDTRRVVAINMHSGIGAGLVSEGKIREGANGVAGEVGHQIIHLNGRPCECGNNGCIEQYGSNRICFKDFADTKGIDVSLVNEKVLRDYYEKNDEDARRILEEHALYMSIVINNMVANFDPDLIILNSVIFKEIPELINSVRKHLTNRITQHIDLRLTKFGNISVLVGGHVVNIENYFKVKRLQFVE
jgi:predicted NBD/HSP70 family sugar kinase